MHQATIMSSWTRRAVSCAREADCDVVDILRRAEIAPATLDDPTGRVAFDRHVAVVTSLAQRLDDPGVGVDIGAQSCAGDFGVVSLLAEACPTLRHALAIVHRFNAVANQASSMAYWVDRDRLFIQDAHLRDGRPAPAVVAEATLAFWATMIRHTCQVEGALAEVWFAHARHRAWTPSRVAHFDAKLRFDRPSNMLVLSAALLDAPLVSARPELSIHLAQWAQHLDAALASEVELRTQLAARVRHDLLHGSLMSLTEVARVLGTSARTLQRQLCATGRSYSDVVDTARRELAPTLLADPDVKVESVARRLGYADARSFRRACLRWYGKPPGRNRDLA